MTEHPPSGLRPPSKIGRPCCTMPPRPAIPPSPTRPSMNTSVVLTEDTDSFIIGDRVWVGGTKPGSIAYIGETQFAPGDWAGVVLDEPIGKNDGSVAGCRYFQCEPKRGIFSRLTRLTRHPLSDAYSTSQKTPTTPPDSVRGSLSKSMSPSLNASTTSLSSTVSQRDLRLGERVIVSSSQGSKTGVLRYLGVTDFAAGEWCGVELDEPIGKNDGSVADRRYFECRPKHGLFAPAHKVTRSPSSKRTSCVVHKPTGAALNSSLKKTGSRESLVSVSSIASSIAGAATRTGAGTTRETLMEKQQEIEFLRKERDLERERVTKAANQADQAEQSAISMKQEYEKYREEMQKAATEAEITLTKLLEEKTALTLQLEDEKRKCEDLLFRFEEESVNKDDIQKERTEQSVINTVNENRIKDLERQLLEERQRVTQLEQDSTKLFETEEELTRLRNEVSSVVAQDKIQFEDLQSRNKGLEEVKATLEKEVSEKSVLVEECVAQIKELEQKLNETQKKSSTQKESESNLQKELERITQVLQEKCTTIENMKKEFETNTNSLKDELQRATEAIETVKKESASEKELVTSKFEKIIEEKENLMKVKVQELETESKRLLEMQNNALESLKAENIKQINELSESFNQQLNIKDSKINEVSSELDRKISETEKLMGELSTQLELAKKKDEDLNSAVQKLEELTGNMKLLEEKNVTLSKQIEDYQSKTDDNFKIIQEKQKLEQDIASLMATEADSSAQLKKLNEELKVKEKELSELRSTTVAQIEELSKRYQHQIEEKSKCIEEVNADVSHKSLLLTKLANDIIELKSIIMSKDEEIKSLLEKTSELQYALTLSEQTKTNLESELRGFECNVEKLNQQVATWENKVSQVTAQKEKLESDIANMISSSADSSEQLMKYNEDLRSKEKELDEMKDKVFKTESSLKSMEGKLTNLEQELSKATSLTQQQHAEIEQFKTELGKEKKTNVELSNQINKYGSLENSSKEEISSLVKQIGELKTELTGSQEEAKALQKMKSKLEADQSANRWSIEELSEKLAAETESRSKLESLVSQKDENIKEIENKLLELQKMNEALTISKENADKNLTSSLDAASNEVKELKDKLIVATDTIKAKEDNLLQAKETVKETEAQITKLNDVIASMKEEQTQNVSEMNKVRETLSKREKEVEEITETKSSLENCVKDLESKLKTISEELGAKTNLLQEMEGKMKEMKNSSDESVSKLQNSLECEIKAKQSELETIVQQKIELEKKQQSLQDLVNTQNADLNSKEAVINKMTAQIKSIEDAQTEKVKADQQTRNEEVKLMQSKLDDVNKQNQNLTHANESLEKLIKEQDAKMEVLSNAMRNKEKEAEKNIQNLVEKMNLVSSESAQLREAQSNLEKENRQITAKWTEATNQLKLTRENIKNNYDAAGGDMKQHIVDKDIDLLKLQKDNETAKSQIDFLNSVIVDMQRKNEALLCKVEVLEMGVPANEADDYTRSTLEKRSAAPRKFCDICDRFDLHETEDCPRQAQDFLEPEKIAKPSKKVSVERPYCENCEIFGHDTRDCDDAETF